MDSTVPQTFCLFFEPFRSLFTAPSFQNFVVLISGWILCVGRHTTSRILQASGATTGPKHHSVFYRFFSRAVWHGDALGQILVGMILPWVPGMRVYAPVDDTLCRKSGPQLWGGAMHHDPLLSTYGRQRRVVLRFGHNWVVLSVWVPLPWNPERGMALPVLFRLYRSPKRCPAGLYRKRTELAAEMVRILAGWLPPDRELMVVADAEYACQTLVKALPPQVHFIGAMNMKAACYDFPPVQQGRGRRRKKGSPLPSPRQLAADAAIPWQTWCLQLYGRPVRLLVKTQHGLWYRVAGTRPLLMMVTRDPRGYLEDRAFFTTDATLGVEGLAQGVARRWPQEVMHRDVKQHLGLEDPQNGWWRRAKGHRRPRKQAGPQPHDQRGQRAVERTVPLVFITYSLVALWYFQHGAVDDDVRRARAQAPWYRQKREPSFADMLQAARRAWWQVRLFEQPALRPLSTKIVALLPDWLLAG